MIGSKFFTIQSAKISPLVIPLVMIEAIKRGVKVPIRTSDGKYVFVGLSDNGTGIAIEPFDTENSHGDMVSKKFTFEEKTQHLYNPDNLPKPHNYTPYSQSQPLNGTPEVLSPVQKAWQAIQEPTPAHMPQMHWHPWDDPNTPQEEENK
jgi:hypothetical protein